MERQRNGEWIVPVSCQCFSRFARHGWRPKRLANRCLRGAACRSSSRDCQFPSSRPVPANKHSRTRSGAMDYPQALERLLNHANLPGSNLPESESFGFTLWQAGQQSHMPELRGLFDDVVECLEAVNHALNTQHPSGTVAGKAEALPRSLVCCVSSILSQGWSDFWRWSSRQQFPERFRAELAVMLVQIGIAWDALFGRRHRPASRAYSDRICGWRLCSITTLQEPPSVGVSTLPGIRSFPESTARRASSAQLTL